MMEKSKHGQITYEEEANKLFGKNSCICHSHECSEDCEWCEVYYYGPPVTLVESGFDIHKDWVHDRWTNGFETISVLVPHKIRKATCSTEPLVIWDQEASRRMAEKILRPNL